MTDADLSDLYQLAGFGTSSAVKLITATRREDGGHIHMRRVFDHS